MKNKLISVVVPCYNVSKYVSKCLDSLLNQTYKNLEIILVEDCSTDDTKKILKEYVKKDKRITLIENKKNSGLSFSRNAGIKVAKGEYIGFIDSDDYVDLDFYEKLINSIDKEKAEVAIADIKVVYEDTNVEQVSKCYTGNKFNLINVVNNGLAASACNKLFKKDLLAKYLFEVGKVNEDIAVVIPALVNAKNISYVENSYYYYIQRGGSIQNSGFSDKRFDIFYGVDTTLDRIKNSKDYEELKDALVYNQLIVLLIYVIPKIKSFTRRVKVIKKYGKLAKKYEIKKNHYYWNFLAQSGRKHAIYYKMLLSLVLGGLAFSASLLITMYKMLSFILKKSVIKKNIGLDDVVNKARYQSKLKKEDIQISVVIPNYNYAKFMYQRLYSVLRQNYKIHEIIILDDCSSDNSREVIDEIVTSINKYVNIRKIYNTKNSGSAFKQWEKGFKEVKGNYVWIAEADDYCEKNLIRKLVNPIKKNKNVVISYSDTAFIDVNGYKTIRSIKPEIDIQNSGHWNRNYVNKGLNEIREYSYLNNTIANVSSCIIKNGDYSKVLKEAGKYKQAGDWLIYVDIMSRGYISYVNKPLNYYRLHGNNVSSVTKHEDHVSELNRLYNYYKKEYKLSKKHETIIEKRIEYLKRCWELD